MSVHAAGAIPLKAFLAGAVAVKAGVLALGYGAYLTASPTGADTRRSLLSHAGRVLGVLEPGKDASWRGDIKTLRKHAAAGWTDPAELAALGRILGRLSYEHAKGSVCAAERIVTTCGGRFWDWSTELAGKLMNFPRNPPPTGGL